MTIWAFRTMIVPTDYRQFAADLAAAIGGVAGEDMFTTGLSATGQEPATHYVSTGYIAKEFADLWPISPDPPGNPAAVVALANDAGFPATLQEVTDLFSVVDCTEQEPFAAFDRLGLQLAQASVP